MIKWDTVCHSNSKMAHKFFRALFTVHFDEPKSMFAKPITKNIEVRRRQSSSASETVLGLFRFLAVQPNNSNLKITNNLVFPSKAS